MKMLIEGVDILIAEDNPNDLELALHGLKKYKLANNIHICRDGEEVLQFLFGDDAAAANPRLILLDLKMPKVDGLQVLRQIKADPRTKSIPVVMMTSSREEQDIVESYRLGVNSYIVKPVDFDQFAEAVRQIGMYWMLFNQPPSNA
jgi:two-component system response regulator